MGRCGDLHWTQKDSEMVEQHMKDVKAGKVRLFDITNLSAEQIRNLPDSASFCANCYCHDNQEGNSKGCNCPCHREESNEPKTT